MKKKTLTKKKQKSFQIPYAHHYKPRLVIFLTPFFTVVYNQERLLLQTIFCSKQGAFSKKSVVNNQDRFQIKGGL